MAASAGEGGGDAASGGANARRQALAQETGMERLWRRLVEEPMIPIGLGVTTAVLGRGMVAMYRGETATSQRMMRYRVLAQGTTILAITYGLLWQSRQARDPAKGRIAAIDKRYYLDHASEYAVEAHLAAGRAAKVGVPPASEVAPKP